MYEHLVVMNDITYDDDDDEWLASKAENWVFIIFGQSVYFPVSDCKWKNK